ncbi:unnamed protein product [Pseudo-nitzschia multistriata]|uniref:Uncharacterized protein n=1 Tax=Pseudo-nitzschia multistriata TaxID=183589 RepID=A0A448Z7R3_9STRA|nr:unnamed protein product [Pseudo-nitzschia multistriata]
MWATLSSPLFLLIIFSRGRTMESSDELTDDGFERMLNDVAENVTSIDDVIEKIDAVANNQNQTYLEYLRAFLDTLFGGILLVVTNYGKAAQYERKAEQHKGVADEMKKVLDSIDRFLKILPPDKNDNAKLSAPNEKKRQTIVHEIEAAFEKVKDMRPSLSPPETIVMAFENIECDMEFLVTVVESTKDEKKRKKRVIRSCTAKNTFEVDLETRFDVFKDGYTDLADIMMKSKSGPKCCLTNSKKARNKVIKGLRKQLNRLRDNQDPDEHKWKTYFEDFGTLLSCKNIDPKKVVDDNEKSAEKPEDATVASTQAARSGKDNPNHNMSGINGANV